MQSKGVGLAVLTDSTMGSNCPCRAPTPPRAAPLAPTQSSSPPASPSLHCCGKRAASRTPQTNIHSFNNNKRVFCFVGFFQDKLSLPSAIPAGLCYSLLGHKHRVCSRSDADAPGRLCWRTHAAPAPGDAEPQGFAIKLLVSA